MKKVGVAAGSLAAATSAYWIAAMFIGPLLKPEFDPRVHWVSEYGVGAQSWMQNSAFFAAGIGILALVIGLSIAGPRSWLCKTGLVLLAVLAPGLVVSGVFHMDLPNQPETTHGLIHDISAYANFVGGVAAQILLAASFGDDDRWRTIRGPAVIVATLCVVVLVTQFLSVQLHFHWSGVINHLFAALLAVWWLLVALRLRHLGLAARPATATSGRAI
jgi:hypothetical protein